MNLFNQMLFRDKRKVIKKTKDVNMVPIVDFHFRDIHHEHPFHHVMIFKRIEENMLNLIIAQVFAHQDVVIQGIDHRPVIL